MFTNPNIQDAYTYDERPRQPGMPGDYLGRYTVATVAEVQLSLDFAHGFGMQVVQKVVQLAETDQQ
ncbi:MAG: hypothetical protein JWO41_687 [Candidatus Saccharibacteria bacterium]|nr:hypothetical protein [Candidatus Saccharibacteria bacterium]